MLKHEEGRMRFRRWNKMKYWSATRATHTLASICLSRKWRNFLLCVRNHVYLLPLPLWEIQSFQTHFLFRNFVWSSSSNWFIASLSPKNRKLVNNTNLTKSVKFKFTDYFNNFSSKTPFFTHWDKTAFFVHLLKRYFKS